jgi:hypothetical protein
MTTLCAESAGGSAAGGAVRSAMTSQFTTGPLQPEAWNPLLLTLRSLAHQHTASVPTDSSAEPRSL